MTYNPDISNKHSSNFHQVILLDEKGMIWESCDSIFDTTTFLDAPVSQHFYFLESEFKAILKSKAIKTSFSQIQTQQSCLPGFYDFVFSKQVINNQITIVWDIFDYTPVYKKYVKVQQIQNELDIHQQFVEKEINPIEEPNGASAQFFQTGYNSKKTLDCSLLNQELLHSNKDVFDLILKDKNIEERTLGLNHLRGHLDALIDEISLFLDEIKKQESEEFEIKTLIDSLLNNDQSSSDAISINTVYIGSVPESINANKSMLSQLITLLCKDEISQKLYQNAVLKVEHKISIQNKANLSLTYTERIVDKSKFEETAAKRIIKLSVLQSLVAISGGALSSEYSDDKLTFEVFLCFPIK